MTAKGRAGGKSQPFDHYATPVRHTLAILQHLPAGVELLDPCAGEGRILEAARMAGYTKLCGIELQPKLAKAADAAGFPVLVGDALDPANPWPAVPLIVTNPPYSFADAFVEKACATVDPLGGTVAFLMRLDWLAAQGREELLAKVGMPDVFVVPRPSFCLSVKCKACGWRATYPIGTPRKSIVCGNAQIAIQPCVRSDLSFSTTDATNYAWMVWGPERQAIVRRLSLPEAA